MHCVRLFVFIELSRVQRRERSCGTFHGQGAIAQMGNFIRFSWHWTSGCPTKYFTAYLLLMQAMGKHLVVSGYRYLQQMTAWTNSYQDLAWDLVPQCAPYNSLAANICACGSWLCGLVSRSSCTMHLFLHSACTERENSSCSIRPL